MCRYPRRPGKTLEQVDSSTSSAPCRTVTSNQHIFLITLLLPLHILHLDRVNNALNNALNTDGKLTMNAFHMPAQRL